MVRPAIALDAREFGKRSASEQARKAAPEHSRAEDLRLFAMTFAAGFLFISILIG